MTTEERVKEVISDWVGLNMEEVVTFSLDANLEDDLGVDPVEKVELVMVLEEEFGIEIPDEDIAKLTTIGDVVKYIENKG